MSGNERAEYLDDACKDNAGLRQDVEWLLAAHREAGEFLDPPAFMCGNTSSQCPVTEAPGTINSQGWGRIVDISNLYLLG